MIRTEHQPATGGIASRAMLAMRGEARLPQAYESAKAALANCASIDECQEWADKAAALASYARQADDNSLRDMAVRIQARAVRRAGELLKQIDGQGNNQHTVGDHGKLTQRQVAADAGMSEHKQLQAVRVANVPGEQFEQAVESAAPPTITALAEQGRKARALHAVPEGFAKATALLGSVSRFAEFCAANDPEHVAGGVLPQEVREVREQVARIDGWLDRFVVSLKG